MTLQSTPQGIILFAHGSRDVLWRQPIEAVASHMQRTSPSLDVECAYLELTEPDLPTTALKMMGRGVKHIAIVPMFLGVGRHAREDLPALVKQLQNLHPDTTFDLRKAIGEEPALTQAMAAIALASIL
jgi:sirohydrochlorin cobaltochelatase